MTIGAWSLVWKTCVCPDDRVEHPQRDGDRDHEWVNVICSQCGKGLTWTWYADKDLAVASHQMDAQTRMALAEELRRYLTGKPLGHLSCHAVNFFVDLYGLPYPPEKRLQALYQRRLLEQEGWQNGPDDVGYWWVIVKGKPMIVRVTGNLVGSPIVVMGHSEPWNHVDFEDSGPWKKADVPDISKGPT